MKRIMILMVSVIMIVGMMIPVKAEEMMNISYDAYFQQTSARSMLDMINKWRNEGSWYYDENNNRVETGSLYPLTYDYDLETIAMQRATQLAVLFDHVQPNGDSITDLVCNGTSIYGENIAAGRLNAADAFELWQENDEDYSGQGHRRGMLSSKYTRIGIAHVNIGGVDYWVQDYGVRSHDSTPTAANDAKQMINMSVPRSLIKGIEVVASTGSLEVENGDAITMPEDCHVLLDFNGGRFVPVQGEKTWAPTNYGTITDQTVTLDPSIVNKEIELSVNGSYQGLTASTSINVFITCKHDLLKYQDNGPMTHDKLCARCGKLLDTESHVWKNNVCIYCGAKKPISKPKTTSIKSLKAFQKGFKMVWKKGQKGISGYQIQYSESRNFKKSKKQFIKNRKITNKAFKKLKSKKKYYVRIRTEYSPVSAPPIAWRAPPVPP